MNEFRILLTGGGSGGHVYPLIAVAEEIKKIAGEEGVEAVLYYYGPRDRWRELLRERGIEVRSIFAPKLRRYFSLPNFLLPFSFLLTLVQVLFKMYWLMPDVIFSKGGPGALAVVLVGWFYRVPVVIHESDAVPGTTNIISGRFARVVAVGFEAAAPYFNSRKAAFTGNPVRAELLATRINTDDAKQQLQFDPKEPLILVLGGSQGSERVNDFILSNLPDILKITQVLHQTGVENFREVQQLSRAALVDIPVAAAVKSRYQPVPYLAENLYLAMSAADLIVSRAGAGSIYETAAFGKPAILIPLDESANDHQRANAYAFAESGAAVVLEEENLLAGVFLSELKSALGNRELLVKRGVASQAFFKPDAATRIAQEILNIVLRIG